MTELKLPIIGVTTYGQNESGCFYLPRPYVDAVRAAGGLPMLLTPGEQNVSEVLSLIDGLLLAGGGDIDPQIYDGVLHPAIYRVDPERDALELTLARLALQTELPILGICRGMQVLGVAGGVKVVAHVPDIYGRQIIHRSEEAVPAEHLVQLVPDSRLAQIMKTTEITVTSLHHQAIQQVPEGWRLVGTAADGLLEAIEHRQHPWAIAVQWHPELLPENAAQQQLFQAFVAAARESRVGPRRLAA